MPGRRRTARACRRRGTPTLILAVMCCTAPRRRYQARRAGSRHRDRHAVRLDTPGALRSVEAGTPFGLRHRFSGLKNFLAKPGMSAGNRAVRNDAEAASGSHALDDLEERRPPLPRTSRRNSGSVNMADVSGGRRWGIRSEESRGKRRNATVPACRGRVSDSNTSTAPPGLDGLDPSWSRLVVTPDLGRLRPHVACSTASLSTPSSPCSACTGTPWSYLWRNVIARAGPGVRVIAVDQLEMGFSGRTGAHADWRSESTTCALTDQLRSPGAS